MRSQEGVLLKRYVQKTVSIEIHCTYHTMITQVIDKVTELMLYTILFVQLVNHNLHKEMLRNVHEEISMVT